MHNRKLNDDLNVNMAVQRPQQKGYAVCIDNLQYCYPSSSKNVLDGLSMTIKTGSIYGLTGSSGCGKTTLLSCIIGNLTDYAGDVYLYGHNIKRSSTQSIVDIPGRGIGYMPQETSLYFQFTIEEMLVYFGQLYGMSLSQTSEVTTELLEFLQLYDKRHSFIGNLSGGQKRRVSFALALAFSAKFIVLDEPTVGMDPLLRIKIWERLRSMVASKGITILITTHYIDEMRLADTIGVMANGQILVEQSPNRFLTLTNTDNLQDAVLSVSKTSYPERFRPCEASIRSIIQEFKEEKCFNYERPRTKTFVDKLRVQLDLFQVMLVKNIKISRRKLVFLLFVIMWPIAQLVVTIEGGGYLKDLPLGVVNHELDYNAYNNSSTASISCPEYTGQYLETCNTQLLSCYFLGLIDKELIELKYFRTEEEAIKAVHDGQSIGYVTFSNAFSENVANYWNILLEDDLFDASRISIRFDKTRPLHVYSYIEPALQRAQEIFMTTIAHVCAGNEELGKGTFRYNEPVFGKMETLSLRGFAGLGSMLTGLFFVSVCSTGFRLVDERMCGMWNRLKTMNITVIPIILADLASGLVICVITTVILVGIVLVKVDMYQTKIFPIVFAAIQTILVGCEGLSLGFLMGTVLTQPIQVALLTTAIVLPINATSGILWRIESQPDVFRYVTQVLFLAAPNNSLHWAWDRGMDVTHVQVWSGLAVAVGYIFLLNCLTVVIFKCRK